MRLVLMRSAGGRCGGSALGMPLAGLRMLVLTGRLGGTCCRSASRTGLEAASKGSFLGRGRLEAPGGRAVFRTGRSYARA